MNILVTGGCGGSDKEWAKAVDKLTKYRIVNFTHKPYRYLIGENIILNTHQLMEMDVILMECNKILKRTYPSYDEYVNNLLRRTARNAVEVDTIYAIGTIGRNGYVEGGTGWGVMTGILYKKTIYVFDQNLNIWLYFDHNQYKWVQIVKPPKPTGKFAGIGTRELKTNGIDEIWNLFLLE